MAMVIHNLPQYKIGNESVKFVARLVATLVKYAIITKPQSWWTWGQEIEIDDNTTNEEWKAVTIRWLKGLRDGSGPWEFTIYPTKYDDPTPAFIITELQRRGIFDIVPREEMGNHLHVRPAPPRHDTVLHWWRMYINAFTLSIIGIRLMSSHGVRLRRSWDNWASYGTDQLPIDEYGSSDRFDSILHTLKYYGGRSYYHITLNRNRKNTLTIEMRICESHPLKAWTFAYLLSYITKNYNKPVFLVRDSYLFKNFYRDLADGRILDENTISFNDIGLEPLLFFNDSERISPKQIILELTNKLPNTSVGYLAKKIIFYVYNIGDIVDRNSIKEFYQWLRGKKKTILDYLKAHVRTNSPMPA